MALESRYYIGNLPPAARSSGFVSVLHSRDWFVRAIDEGSLHVAVIDQRVAGFIAMTAPPHKNAPGLSPVIKTMLEQAEILEFDGAPIAAQRYALRGPVCIAEEARGVGIYSAFNAVTAVAYCDRFDLAVLFVSTENPRSLHTSTTKLGAASLAVFDVDGRRYHLLAYSLGPRPTAGAHRTVRSGGLGSD